MPRSMTSGSSSGQSPVTSTTMSDCIDCCASTTRCNTSSSLPRYTAIPAFWAHAARISSPAPVEVANTISSTRRHARSRFTSRPRAGVPPMSIRTLPGRRDEPIRASMLATTRMISRARSGAAAHEPYVSPKSDRRSWRRQVGRHRFHSKAALVRACVPRRDTDPFRRCGWSA